MMPRSLFMLAICLVTMPAWGAERKFPYAAQIDIAEEYVRSGPGQKFYPTSKLRRGDRVSVHRHDPGGWVMIAPPEGSFSWIQADYVRRKPPQSGILAENHVIVRVGSQFNDERDWYQLELSKGDLVEILGEKTFDTDRGPVKMYKIKPPANEYRWILGRAIVPADLPVRQPIRDGDVAGNPPPKNKSPIDANGADPFAEGPVSEVDLAEKPADRKSVSADPVRQTGPKASELEQMRSGLAAVDEEFRLMIKEEPTAWNLAKVEQQYHDLKTVSDLPAYQTQLKLRLDAVARYARIKQEYDEFQRVTTETRQRDAQLLSLRNGSLTQPPATEPATPPAATTPPATARPGPNLPKTFDGAGVIQRAAANGRVGPVYALVAPGGRFLAYLQPAPGVDLNPYLGQAMGVIGQRSYRQELNAELIVVRSLTPVKLRGN